MQLLFIACALLLMAQFVPQFLQCACPVYALALLPRQPQRLGLCCVLLLDETPVTQATMVQDGHGLSLLGYVAGINSMRMSKLLDCLIRYSPRKSVGLLSCTRWEGAASEQEDMAATIDGALFTGFCCAACC